MSSAVMSSPAVDTSEEFFLFFLFGRLSPVDHQPIDIHRQDLVANLFIAFAHPGVTAKDPICRLVECGTRWSITIEAPKRSGERLHRPADPRIAKARSTVDRSRSDTGNPQRRIGGLQRSWMHGEFGERVESTFEGRVLVLPHQSHDGEGFFHTCTAFFEIRTMHVVFKRPPTHANTESDASTRNLIDGRNLLGDAHGIVDWKLEDSRSDSNG